MRVRREECAALLIDFQERLFPVIEGRQRIESRVVRLIQGLKELGVPLLLTQQYTKGLGATVPAVAEALEGTEPVEKSSFSCCGEPAFLSELESVEKKTILVAGIEAHICVLQTVLDLGARGYLPVVVADCVGSRNPEDRAVALERMRDAGAVITTYESILFELLGGAGTPEFKAVSKNVK